MRVTERSWPAIVTWTLLFLLTACGSGNLGKIIGSPNAAPEPAVTPSAAVEVDTQFDAGRLHGYCGDGTVQPGSGEQCDGRDVLGRTCESLGLGTGLVGCDPSTCQLVTAPCRQVVGNAAGPPPGSADAGAIDGGKVDAAGVPMTSGTCPTGFLCQPSTLDAGRSVCVSWAEETPPLCLTAGADPTCTQQLPGSVCTDTGVGMYCVLSCTA